MQLEGTDLTANQAMAQRQPLHERIEQELRRRLRAASEGDRFPSESELASEFSVSRMTARVALQRLERDGMLDRVPGKGSFVRRAAAARPVGTLMSFHDQALAAGRVPRSRVLEAGLRRPNREEATALQVRGRAPSEVVGISRIRCFDDLPIAIERAAFAPQLSGLLAADLQTGSVHAALRGLGVTLAQGTSIISARTAGEDATALEVSPETALLVETRTVLDAGRRPVEHTTSAYVAQRYALQVSFAVTGPGPGRGASPARRRRQ